MGNKNDAVKAHKVNVIIFMYTVVGGQKEDKHLLHLIIFSSFIFGNLFFPCLKSFLHVADIGQERLSLHTPCATLCIVLLAAAVEQATPIITT
jgi:hypothetical protein